jgi:hypothetical protein
MDGRRASTGEAHSKQAANTAVSLSTSRDPPTERLFKIATEFDSSDFDDAFYSV